MTYKLYFMFQKDSGKFDAESLREYVKWVLPQLGGNCLAHGVELADLINTQVIFDFQYKAIIWYEFKDRNICFDSFKPNFVEILDKMMEVTDVPPQIHGTYAD